MELSDDFQSAVIAANIAEGQAGESNESTSDAQGINPTDCF